MHLCEKCKFLIIYLYLTVTVMLKYYHTRAYM